MTALLPLIRYLALLGFLTWRRQARKRWRGAERAWTPQGGAVDLCPACGRVRRAPTVLTASCARTGPSKHKTTHDR